MTAAPRALSYIWDGESFTPASPSAARQADKDFVVGAMYPLEVREDRSPNSHNHYFAALHEAWLNLPHRLSEKFPTPEHLRKFALVKTGYADERSIACPSNEEAERLSAFIKPLDEFAVVAVQENIVTVWTAKSQSMRSMAKREFQDSKTAVLDYVASLIGTSVAVLRRHTVSVA